VSKKLRLIHSFTTSQTYSLFSIIGNFEEPGNWLTFAYTPLKNYSENVCAYAHTEEEDSFQREGQIAAGIHKILLTHHKLQDSFTKTMEIGKISLGTNQVNVLEESMRRSKITSGRVTCHVDTRAS